MIGAIIWLPLDANAEQMAVFYVVIGLAIASIFTISMLKGPSPRWRLGKSDDDDPEEDI